MHLAIKQTRIGFAQTHVVSTSKASSIAAGLLVDDVMEEMASARLCECGWRKKEARC